MITPGIVLEFLLPEGGWKINGQEYENIDFGTGRKITKDEYTNAFALLESKEKEKPALKSSAIAKLAALGLTEDEIAAL